MGKYLDIPAECVNCGFEQFAHVRTIKGFMEYKPAKKWFGITIRSEKPSGFWRDSTRFTVRRCVNCTKPALIRSRNAVGFGPRVAIRTIFKMFGAK